MKLGILIAVSFGLILVASLACERPQTQSNQPPAVSDVKLYKQVEWNMYYIGVPTESQKWGNWGMDTTFVKGYTQLKNDIGGKTIAIVPASGGWHNGEIIGYFVILEHAIR